MSSLGMKSNNIVTKMRMHGWILCLEMLWKSCKNGNLVAPVNNWMWLWWLCMDCPSMECPSMECILFIKTNKQGRTWSVPSDISLLPLYLRRITRRSLQTDLKVCSTPSTIPEAHSVKSVTKRPQGSSHLDQSCMGC